MTTYLDVFRYRDLFANLFRRDLHAKYRGSALGVLWTVANPVMLMGVYLFVFGVVWKSPFSNGGHYPLFLLSGLAVWTFFTAALLSSTRSMLDNANLIRKTKFPRQLVPLSVVAAHLVSFVAMLALLLVVNFIALPRASATELLAIPHAALFVADESVRCDVCNAVVAEDADEGYAVAGRGLYVWARGEDVRYEEPHLCAGCAAAVGVSALARWEIEEEEG